VKYVEITPLARSEAEVILEDGPPEMISMALLRLAYHEPDWKWVQDLCIRFSQHTDSWVRKNCLICFSHLVRIHGKLEMEKVQPVLDRAFADPETRGYAEDVIDDLKAFLRPKRK
jgi:hypothetical protein